ncbi:hypothetical protein BDA96_05G045300 [Sorghum bicolor]|uniref:Uncharacterized protein n=2 Tax=Sorghum bicolor TaxID=4558 RepID=A0A921QW51_SORBI|nr:uncharacterized protein LOC8058571 [Sorghum bicolor]EES09299.1 hypothetical protein SORBI_3005G042900 [Sorghum bicolor]KAG0528814.1 hypothetical protein BDA96_05G045300 [Sorghum bicolor]|eukprot:XP_002450311.1 uncharacterized protein LOC8058571 [Sorghum bicolor]
MVTAVVESPLRQRQRQRLRSPLAGAAGSTGGGGDLVEFAHRRPAKRASGSGGGMRGRWAPPEIEIPTNALDATGGGGHGYTSLRDIMSSPEYAAAAAKAHSPDEAPAGGAVVAGDVHMIRHPLVKHAAYTYLQLTPSAREEARRRMLLQRRRGMVCRLFLGCLGFLGALFGRP